LGNAYSLPTDPRSAAAFERTTRVVVGTVVHVSDPFTPTLSEEVLRRAGAEDIFANMLVSRRLTVKISAVLRGRDVVGQTLDIRIFEGQLGDLPSTEWLDGLELGAAIAVFGGRSVTYEHGGTMLTPNDLLFESNGRFEPRPARTGAESVTLKELTDLVDATARPRDCPARRARCRGPRARLTWRRRGARSRLSASSHPPRN
jgi:hypothetical protein